MLDDRREKYCIIGAGSSGLTVVKNFKQLAIPADCLEREDQIGGNWYYGAKCSSVYRSTHLISSKAITQYTDFPMPDAFPEYPNHAQAWEYLKSYAQHFGLSEQIEFNSSVARLEPSGEFWDVTLKDGPTRRYQGVVIANGHNWDPKWPDYPGEFSGTVLHSSQYKTPDLLQGKRVLVVGGGNSGCDIAVESAQRAAKTLHSVRRSYHYVPKFLFGRPVDQLGERLLRWRCPLWLRRAVTLMALKIAQGSPANYGLPLPDHKLFESHPIINSQLLYFVGHGDIEIKPQLTALRGDHVQFADGSEESIDVIIFATGFRISIPFIDLRHLNWKNGRPDLYMNVFHRERDNLFVAGLIQPDSGQWGLVDYQAQLIARYIRELSENSRTAKRFHQWKSTDRPDLSRGIQYVDSARHRIEVEHFSYRKRLKKLIAQLERG